MRTRRENSELQGYYQQVDNFTKLRTKIAKIPVNSLSNRHLLHQEIQLLTNSKPIIQNILNILCSTRMRKSETSSYEFKKYILNRRKITTLLNELNVRLFRLAEQLDLLNSNVFESVLVERVTSKTVECAICLGDVEAFENSTYLKDTCKHEFHRSCIKSWILEKSSCPVCRADIVFI